MSYDKVTVVAIAKLLAIWSSYITGKLPVVDLKGVDLSAEKLKFVNLSRADLRGCKAIRSSYFKL